MVGLKQGFEWVHLMRGSQLATGGLNFQSFPDQRPK